MNIFVVNSGSSSIKYQLFRMPNEKPVCIGLVERIGLEASIITHRVFTDGDEKIIRKTIDLPDHQSGLYEVAQLLANAEIGVIQNPDEIEAVGHRVVHGGESFSSTSVITKEVKEEIKKLFSLAPLHNPANFLGIEVAEKIFSKAIQVAVFDTSFHQTLPEKAFLYAIPKSLYTDMGIRAYGFHGTSHKYVSEKTLQHLQNNQAKIVTIHLGNGCSMAAVHAGISVDTSMGFGPLSGLVMGTRSGDIDPSIIFHLVNQLGFSLEQVNHWFNKNSGMLGLTGNSDMRDILKAKSAGSKDADLAYEIYAYRIKKYIGSYAAIMNGLDAIVFTAGVGENDATTRRMVCTQMDYLGIKLDEEKNEERNGNIRDISKNDSPVKILIVPTNEELEIVKQCYTLLRDGVQNI
ncbi:MAG: acetate kinase [Chitinophagaceae bacterium]|nr:MAG: acetate kinase [Chitinophagaceae bacterium]